MFFEKLLGRNKGNKLEGKEGIQGVWVSCSSCGWKAQILAGVNGQNINPNDLATIKTLAENHYVAFGGIGRLEGPGTVIIFGDSEHRKFYLWIGDKHGGTVPNPSYIELDYHPSMPPKNPTNN